MKKSKPKPEHVLTARCMEPNCQWSFESQDRLEFRVAVHSHGHRRGEVAKRIKRPTEPTKR